jgi:protein O-mannosyl-transferase
VKRSRRPTGTPAQTSEKTSAKTSDRSPGKPRPETAAPSPLAEPTRPTAAPRIGPERSPPWTARDAGLLIGIAAAIALAYANSLDGAFALDAQVLVLANPTAQSATWANVAAAFAQDYWHPMGSGGLYRPATILSYLVDYAVLGHGARPFGYHLTNLLLHLANTALVYALVRRSASALWPAAAAAALFGLHPITTEAVTYIAGRADLLATLGTLTALLFHDGDPTAARAPARARILSTVGFALGAALACFAKESGLVLPLVLVAHDVLLGRRPGAHTRYAILAAIFASYAGLRLYAAESSLPVEATPALDNPLVETSWLSARLTAIAVAVRALGLLVWPATLSADYSCCEIGIVAWPPAGLDLLRIVAAVVVAMLLAVWSLRQRRRHPERTFFVLFAVLTWLPASNLPVTIGTILAERTLYLPLVGVAAVVASLLDEMRTSPRPLLARAVTPVLAVVLLVAAVRLHQRNEDWRDERRLWSSALEAVPGSAKAHAALAAALFSDSAGAADIERIVMLGERAIAIRPDYQNALVALGGHSVTKGDRIAAIAGGAPEAAQASRAAYDRAVAVLERARALDDASVARFRERMAARGAAPEDVPDRADPQLYNNLSLAYLRTGRLADALTAYERTRDLEPLKARRHADVAVSLIQLGRWEDAAVELFVATALDPNDAELESWLVEVYRRFGNADSALRQDSRGDARLDLDDPKVRAHRCRALAVEERLRSGAGDARGVGSIRDRRQTDCPEGLPSTS